MIFKNSGKHSKLPAIGRAARAIALPKQHEECLDTLTLDIDSIASLSLSDDTFTNADDETDSSTVPTGSLSPTASSHEFLPKASRFVPSIHLKEPSMDIAEMSRDDIVDRGLSQLLNIDPEFAMDILEALPNDLSSNMLAQKQALSPRSPRSV